jgi:hypothetical protein
LGRSRLTPIVPKRTEKKQRNSQLDGRYEIPKLASSQKEEGEEEEEKEEGEERESAT